MSITIRMQLAFAAVFFECRQLVDYVLPPNNPTFNAALALLAALCMFARWVEQKSKGSDHQS